MEASVSNRQTLNESVIKGLEDIVGKDQIVSGQDAASPFLRPGCQAPGLVKVCPGTTEDVQAIVNLARSNNVAVVTCNDRYLLPEDLNREGILLDFSQMKTIEKIDDRNLTAHIERGVTWDQLNAELKKLGVKTVAPLAANSNSVVESIIARAPGKNITKFPDYAMMNMKVVLGDGSIVLTGSHGLREEASDGRNEGGPNLSQWYVGADDVLGIVTRVTIMLYPVCDAHTCNVYAFDSYDEVVSALKDVPRTDVGSEFMGLNKAALKNLLGEDKEYPNWALVVGFDGRKKLTDHNENKVKALLSGYQCQPVDELNQALAEKLDEPWMEASDNHTAFFAIFSKTAELNKTADQAAQQAGIQESDVGKMLVSIDRGRAVYATYDWFSAQDQAEAMTQLNLALSDKGAFFDRPHGPLGRKIYTSIENHLPVLKHIKNMLDPDNILNPGRIIREEDKEWMPLSVREGEIGLTVANLKEIKGKLAECVGEEWVSDNPVDLSSYGRDFTIFSGERPNLVIFPKVIEEIQQIVRLAYEHGIPIIPQTTGFNHGGLTVSRKGGLLVDLRRMDDTCSIDEETMTITVSPAVRMRSIWWESVKHRAKPNYHLKPILPLTLGSVSLLSNYVARGAPASAFKYGTSTELTVNMTWVLNNGEILKVGPSAVPGVGDLPLHYGIGPEINGMFFNADGQFGICTQLTGKLYPEHDDVEEMQTILIASITENDEHKAFVKIIDLFYDLGRENITEFQYKAHPGTFALALTAQIEGTKIMDMVGIAPRHPIGIIVVGCDAEELAIREEILKDILDKNSMFTIDPALFGDDLANMASADLTKKSLGIGDNFVGSYKGAFQWTAGQIKMDKLPDIAMEYNALAKKYWTTSDPKIGVVESMTDAAVQGPLPMGRAGPAEFDFWWDQGNPEEVKRATTMLHKTNHLLLKYGASLWRNMFGAGEYHLPMWGTYFEILKRTKKAFDPDNLMHPDVMPLTDDFV